MGHYIYNLIFCNIELHTLPLLWNVSIGAGDVNHPPALKQYILLAAPKRIIPTVLTALSASQQRFNHLQACHSHSKKTIMQCILYATLVLFLKINSNVCRPSFVPTHTISGDNDALLCQKIAEVGSFSLHQCATNGTLDARKSFLCELNADYRNSSALQCIASPRFARSAQSLRLSQALVRTCPPGV